MNWYKIILTDKQDPADHMEIFESLVFKALKSGLLKKNKNGVFSDYLHSPNLIRGDPKIFYLNPPTFEALKEQLTHYEIESCAEPNVRQLSRIA